MGVPVRLLQPRRSHTDTVQRLRPLRIRNYFPCSFPDAVDFLAEALEAEGFSITSREDIPSGSGEARCLLVRAQYPRVSVRMSRLGAVIRCRVVLRELEPGAVEVEITKPVRLLDTGDPAIRREARNADARLRGLIRTLSELFAPAPSRTG
jgi:hypothetical protein